MKLHTVHLPRIQQGSQKSGADIHVWPLFAIRSDSLSTVFCSDKLETNLFFYLNSYFKLNIYVYMYV
jgi:hypothetical protein